MKAIASLILACLCACSTTHTTPVETPPPPPVQVQSDTILTKVLVYGTHTFRGTQAMTLATSKIDEATQQYNAMYIDHQRNLMVLIKTAPTTDTLETLAANIAVSLAASGFASGYPAVIVWLNNQAIQFPVERGTLHALQWIGLVNGQGIAFTCGGLLEDAHTNDALCRQIAESVMLMPLDPIGGNN